MIISSQHNYIAQLLVRQLDMDVKGALQRGARAHRRSTGQEVRVILRDAVRAGPPGPVRLGSKIASRFRDDGVEHDVAEFRGHPAHGGTSLAMILLDTNVLSALMRSEPEAVVVDWLDAQPAASIGTTSVTVLEVRTGLELLTPSR